jgi:tetratricopeptide (TPR) repeat protein
MPRAHPDKPDVKYSIEAQATSLFDFLRQTFLKMPRPVQVVGWLVFLLLFVFLVLYPIIGITYFNGKIVMLKRGQDGQSIMGVEPGLRISKSSPTITNDEGEFTLAVRVPNVPMMNVEFDFGAGERREIVSLPGPLPLVSMFDPNTRKIYYVPGSNVKNAFGVTKRFFLDSEEAGKAFLESIGQKPTGSTSSAPSAISLLIQQLGKSGIAHAAVQLYVEQTYTLRLQDLNISGLPSSTSEIYFEVSIDGVPVQIRGLPHAGSRKADFLTVFNGVPVKLQGLDIPLQKSSNNIEIAVISSGVLRDTKVGSVAFQLNAEQIGKKIKQTGKGLELTFEYFPPLAVRYVSSEKRDSGILAVMWLDGPSEHLGSITSVLYDVGAPGNGFTSFNRAEHFKYSLNLPQPEKATAQVTFASGSSIKLGAYLQPTQGGAKSALDYHFQAVLSRISNDNQQALGWIDKAIQGEPNYAPSLGVKADALMALGRYEEALRWYERAIAADPRNADMLNGYAYAVADKLPNPTAAQLSLARQRALLAIQAFQDSNYYDTLGWVYFRLGEYPQAVEALLRARSIQARDSKTNTVWQEINFHLGHVYLKMGKRREAEEAFNLVVEFAKQQGYFVASVQARDTDAKIQLKRLR